MVFSSKTFTIDGVGIICLGDLCSLLEEIMCQVLEEFKNPELFECRLEMGVNVYFIHTYIIHHTYWSEVVCSHSPDSADVAIKHCSCRY